PPATLASLMAAGRHYGLAYAFLYGDNQADAGGSRWTPVTQAAAADQLLGAWGDADEGLRQQVTFILKSLFQDAAFRASDVKVYLIHWDNGDDTNAEGIAAVKSSTGEIRVL